MAELHYFPFYAKDWLTGQGTAAMLPEAKGGFIDLLAHAWLADPPCTLPDHDATLARLSGLGRKWRTHASAIRAEFDVIDGRLRNPKQYAVYLEAMEKHARRVAAGAKGGKARAELQQSASNAQAMLGGGYQQSASNQSQSQNHKELTTPPPPRARVASEAYQAVLLELPAPYRADFDALLDQVPNGEAWCREVRGYLEGMGRQPVTAEQVGVGIRHYVAAGKAADAKPRQLWRYVTGAKDEPAPATGNGKHGKPTGPRTYDYSGANEAATEESEIAWTDTRAQ